ncbi:tRNA (N6-isopentenyl adenosine(37)-C2)-methylthiotransferase MiaB [Desulfosudis oleivorans]|uniref:tRNA-2-methylthio-N(6)-dimethylallyladenosine synthase n=1 Tax=Desulfosudis oleivorans (strain DSM 6200 / JCM 39069 / Hxd3) TaxID=96561 RepID=MIAB_DESOH|nr:tRNA (N6-isopentenyl adenosine(37)-C2)-methylthiotransferase MiaB [Desulfosudis oleivorans]A8ZVH2.1 RecName: Full=tRNA-2-methylthio-N(6)-dimethylallyladenosine synthase; AltName: Full=(Dimethylallyl)adenosine tRNA methylthiotransferase MiaB; AltName: Full=tRNA-i(6)A37 methylthiotransferase [Desulfosudis oleivorans Hxd3]ABW68159.1 RNA modification enzyme, MiaB family [Desulfosudis oleivorans Hxd3]
MKRFYIHTIGCQMNVYDSSQLSAILTAMGHRSVNAPEQADLVFVNTCTIRAKAKQKATSFVGRLAAMKRARPDMIVGVGGCLAQEEGRQLLDAFPCVDIVFGTHALGRLPGHIQAVAHQGDRIVDVEMTAAIDESVHALQGPDSSGVTGFITIMRGCDNFCTYCVVPYVRGRETSRAPEHILDEIRARVAGGLREITLLGQNVNSYGQKEGLCSFADLLARVNEIDGLHRIRFTTSHPKDLSPELAAAFTSLDKLCSHVHLPAQSGSDAVLKRMNRRYTRQAYLEKLHWLREAQPGMALSTDIIVGFPGETEQDFLQTLDLIEKVRYDSIFAFMYSDRPLAPARAFDGKVDEAEKQQRIYALLELQNRITAEKNRALEGRVEQVLVEGKSKSSGRNDITADTVQWTGRTTCNRVANFTVPRELASGNAVGPGAMVRVEIMSGLAHSLSGIAVGVEKPGAGGDAHAA